MPGAWSYRPHTGTGWPGVSILSVGEIHLGSPTDHDVRSQENPEGNEKQQGSGHR